jgi:hypothetical protein
VVHFFIHLLHFKPVLRFGNDIWLGDSGALCHYYNNDNALYDCTMISEPKKTEDDLSDLELERDDNDEQKESELPTKKYKAANNKKGLKQNSKVKAGLNLIHQDSWND